MNKNFTSLSKHLSRLNYLKVVGFIAFLFGAIIQSEIYAQDFSEDFEDGIPEEWGLFLNETANEDWEASTDGHESDGAAVLDPEEDNIGEGNTGEYFLVTPNIEVPEDGQIRFWSKYDAVGDENTVYRVMVSTLPQPDINEFIEIESWTAEEVEDYLEYGEQVVDMPSGITEGTDVLLAFVVENTQTDSDPTGSFWTIDDVLLTSGCPLIEEDEIEINNITVNTAVVEWAHPTAEEFEIQVVEEGEDIDENAGTTVSDFTYEIEDLEEETTYDVYLKANCPDNIEGVWQPAGSFETLKYGISCEGPIELSDNYSLEANLDEFPNAEEGDYDTAGADCFSGEENFLAGNKIFFSYTAQEDGVINLSQMTLPFEAGTGCFGNATTGIMIYEDCSSVGEECLASLETTMTDDTEYINDFPVEAGETYIVVMSSTYEESDTPICFDFTFGFSQCPAPTDVDVSNVQQNSAEASWSSDADSWEYIVQPAELDAPEDQEAGTATDTNQNVEISGLEEATTYNLYIKSICDAEGGEWSESTTFTTQCGVFTISYEESFEGATEEDPAECWTFLDANSDNAGWHYLLDAASIFYSDASEFDDYLVSPALDMSGAQKRIKFEYQAMGGDVEFAVLASEEGIGADNFNIEISSNQTYEETEFGEFEEIEMFVSESVDDVANIAWYVTTSTDATRLYIRNVVVEDAIDCLIPTDLSAEEATENSALLSWEPAEENDDQWEVFIQERGEGAPAEEEEGTLVDESSYLAEDLSATSRYEFYVRTVCTESAKSEWSEMHEFHTLCTPVAEDYYETFDNDIDPNEENNPDTKRFCWDFIDENDDGQTWEFTETHVEINLAETNNEDWLISPAIILDGENHKLEFNHKSEGGESYDIEVMISDSDTDLENFTELFTYTANESDQEYKEELEYFEASETIYLAFRISPNMEFSEGQTIQIDDFSVEKADACPAPFDIEREEETNTFTWEAGDEETQWEVALLPEGETFPINGTIVEEPTYTIEEELEEGEEYKFFVRAICDTNNPSDWTGPLKFITDCGQVFDTPFIETFENDSESLNCWIPNDWLLQSALSPYEGDYVAEIYTWGEETDRWMISPTIDIEEDQMLSFYYKASQYSPEYSEDLHVWISTEGNTPDDFTELLFEDHDFAHTDYKKAAVALPEGVSGEVHVAFEIPPEITNVNEWRQNVFIDNVEIKDIPECTDPFNIEVEEINDTDFELSWENVGDEEEWEVLVLPYGTEDPFEDIDPEDIHVLTENPGTVSGLEPSTAYDVYIRSACSEDSFGSWSELIPITTMCDFDEQCLYTITLHSGDDNTQGISGGIDVMQNGFVTQTLEFPAGSWSEPVEPLEYQVYLCDGVEFSLFWDSDGWASDQYPDAWVKVEDADGEEIWMSEMGIGDPRSTIYTGTETCSEISCEQPTDLDVSEDGVLSWTPGGEEIQWEVFIQPYELGAIPSEGVIVDSPTYTPTEEDFINGEDEVYEYFVRAICDEDEQSFWSGPQEFILNDGSSNGKSAPVNEDEECLEALENLTFLGSTPSEEELSVDIPNNSGDIWVDFTPTSTTHQIEVGDFSGHIYEGGYGQLPDIVMVLYKENEEGDLEELGWSDNNVLRTMHSMEVTPDENYKIRLINTADEIPNEYTFGVCITTITDPCAVNAPNHSFEKPGMEGSHTTQLEVFQEVIPGWKDNTTVIPGKIFFWGTENDFFPAYHAGQMVQLPFQDDLPEPPATDAEEVHGVYQDFNTEGVTQYDYSFAHRQRGDEPSLKYVQLYAGPVGGPYELIKEEVSVNANWSIAVGKYDVPEDQDRTRLIFRPKNNSGTIVLDEVNFIPNNKIYSIDHTVDCNENETLLKAEGYGEWIADEDNPGEVSIGEPEEKETELTDFTAPGEYTFYWKTRYCEDSVTIVYEGLEETPEVETPVTYCVDQEAEPLQAESHEDYEVVYFEDLDDDPAESITPNTDEIGTFIYYAAFASDEGCMGEPVEIEVIVEEGLEETPEVESPIEYCQDEEAEPLTVSSSGTYEVLYFEDEDEEGVETITPNTEETGTFTYYAAFVSEEGCMSELVPIEVIVNEPEEAITEFFYDDYVYCVEDENPTPIVEEGFVEEGEFTASPSGLSVNPEDGTINLEESEAGIYEITYSVEEDVENCVLANSYTTDVEILEGPEFKLESYCEGANFMIAPGFSDAEDSEMEYSWTDESGTPLGYDNELDFNEAMPDAELPTKVYLTVEAEECSYTEEITVTNSLCKIPEGISPNADGYNDSFDLSGMGVKEIKIFNRYGNKVYSKKNYTNEWEGQNDNGKELPSGTYYYVIKTGDNDTIKGWVYVNREY